MLTRIGELPIDIDSDGNDLHRNAIRFSYVVNSQNYNHKTHGLEKTTDIGLGTPIFDTYCDANNTKAPELVMQKDELSNPHGDDNKCFPNGYLYVEYFDWKDGLYTSKSSDENRTTKDKYRNCVVTYDN